ncbi:DNA-binding response regulator [Noviherbaspirillum cavernae]|uniref:DNA-binding response regulator n=1 Tax=Noviherbaspirillum cavernae TaxID=2320862 RepID=A0A418X529_9BURK|nr:LuxR C-terminal-related transcriptional regulator [Noviherbaspirillum cavernae]RJG07530.1 DNA-binding response regulator [Noviherbaspirillum cavernae]
MNLTTKEAASLGELVNWLGQDCSEREIRVHVGEQLLRLLKADYYASFSWDAAARSFSDTVSINMSLDNLSAYERYYQFHDPITHELQKRRLPTLVAQVMPQAELMKTEFFNDFLARDGLHHGVNLYAYDGDDNIGDMRIWRGRRRDGFDRTTLAILAIVQPVFTSALKRARARRAQVPTQIPAQIPHSASASTLSRREQAIAQCVCSGMCDKAIAQQLGIEFSTVRTHLSRIFDKLGVHSRTQLIQRLADKRP